jgi:hypothetical protein
MRTTFAIFMLAVVLASCASQEEIQRRQRAARDVQDRLASARSNGGTVNCPDKRTCDKAFSWTKVYVQDNSKMRVQMSDDTMVSTLGPTQYGYVGLRATKIPGAGDSATIELVATCRGIDDSIFQTDCTDKLVRVYGGFRTFVETRMKQ